MSDLREVRLALVFNGGVSLAIWMGGVTRELDVARRAADHGAQEGGTTALYHRLLLALGLRVRVDVVAGASAGGINGAMLAAAVAADEPLPDLREIWTRVADLDELLCPADTADPPSLLQGDTLLRELRDKLAPLSPAPQRSGDPIYLYVTATNLRGVRRDYEDSTGQSFRESDHRRVFAFERPPASRVPAAGPTDRPLDSGRPVPFGHPDAAERLAQAARASSSFPVAFAASQPLGDADGWFIDGGVLDNQPFGPVLDRIAALPAEGRAVKRVVAYVVPYVDDGSDRTGPATVIETLGAGLMLARDLPKLQSLDRLVRLQSSQRAAELERSRRPVIADDELARVASTLLPSYRFTRDFAARTTYAEWATEDFVAGDGHEGQTPGAPRARQPPLPTSEPSDAPWIPASEIWGRERAEWKWGLSPAERVATGALLALRPHLGAPDREGISAARNHASALIWDIRALKQQLAECFRSQGDSSGEDRAAAAYRALTVGDRPGLPWLQEQFCDLDRLLMAAEVELPSVQRLLREEVVGNATEVESRSPFPFDFVLMSSAGRNALGHESSTPREKLGGMKLGHFGGFLKGSWRASDWTWGRLDGVEHVVRATVDAQALGTPGAIAALVALAFPAEDDELRAVLVERWASMASDLEIDATQPPEGQLADALRVAGDSAAYLDACRSILAARIQVVVLGEELHHVAEAAQADVAAGSSATTTGAVWAATWPAGAPPTTRDLVARFRSMKIGEEGIGDELRSARGHDLGAHVAAVLGAVIAGDRSGLPDAVRRFGRILRELTPALGRIARLWLRPRG